MFRYYRIINIDVLCSFSMWLIFSTYFLLINVWLFCLEQCVYNCGDDWCFLKDFIISYTQTQRTWKTQTQRTWKTQTQRTWKTDSAVAIFTDCRKLKNLNLCFIKFFWSFMSEKFWHSSYKVFTNLLYHQSQYPYSHIS